MRSKRFFGNLLSEFWEKKSIVNYKILCTLFFWAISNRLIGTKVQNHHSIFWMWFSLNKVQVVVCIGRKFICCAYMYWAGFNSEHSFQNFFSRKFSKNNSESSVKTFCVWTLYKKIMWKFNAALPTAHFDCGAPTQEPDQSCH